MSDVKCLRELHRVIKDKKKEKIPVSHIWTLYQKYNDFHKCSPNYDICIYDKDHKILYFLLEKLYLAQCNDVQLISEIIKRLFNEKFNVNILVSNLFNEEKDSETSEIVPMLEYFLKCTYTTKTLFHGKRMASAECIFSEISLPLNYYNSYLPTIMKILLQYGSFLDPLTGESDIVCDYSDSRITDPKNGYHTYTINLLWHSILREGIVKVNPQFLPVDELPKQRKDIFNISLEISNLLMRTSLNITISVFLSPLKRLDSYVYNLSSFYWWSGSCNSKSNPSTADIVTFIHKLGRFIPQLPRRCLEPLSLKHCCKQIIRKSLHLNWKLPSGIFNLNLPMPLVKYLNLEID